MPGLSEVTGQLEQIDQVSDERYVWVAESELAKFRNVHHNAELGELLMVVFDHPVFAVFLGGIPALRAASGYCSINKCLITVPFESQI